MNSTNLSMFFKRYVSTYPNDQANAFAAVVRATTTQADDGIAVVTGVSFNTIHHVFVGGVWLCSIKDDRAQACGFYIALDPIIRRAAGCVVILEEDPL